MKYTIIIIFIALATTTLMAQQEEKPLNHNLIIGIGIGDFPKIHFLDNDIEERRSLPLSYGLEYRLDYKRFNLKVSGSFKRISLKGYSDPWSFISFFDEDPFIYGIDRRRFNMMAGFSYKWLKKERIELYSGLELGTAFIYQDKWTREINSDQVSVQSEKGFQLAGHLNYLGCRYFIGKHLYGITELGLGDKGIVHTGIGLRF